MHFGKSESAIHSYSASHDNWCTVILWNRIMTAQCEGMGEVGSARYEPALLPPCLSIRVLSYSNCQRSPNHTSSLRVNTQRLSEFALSDLSSMQRILGEGIAYLLCLYFVSAGKRCLRCLLYIFHLKIGLLYRFFASVYRWSRTEKMLPRIFLVTLLVFLAGLPLSR